MLNSLYTLLQKVIIANLTLRTPQDLNPAHYNVVILVTVILDLPRLFGFEGRGRGQAQSEMPMGLHQKASQQEMQQSHGITRDGVVFSNF